MASIFPNSHHFEILGGTYNAVQGNQTNQTFIITDEKAFENIKENPLFFKLLRYLTPPSFVDPFGVCCRNRLQGTCEWSLSHPDISAWLSSDTPCLWLHGKPGTGKTILAAYLVEEAKKRAPLDEIVLYSFCKDQGNVKQTSVFILRQFIRQCLENYPFDVKALPGLWAQIVSHDKRYPFSEDELKPHLFSLLEPFKKLWFIIDGLDECNKNVVEPGGLIDVLADAPNSKVLVISQRQEHIQTRLESWKKLEIGGDGTTQVDIQHFVSKQVAKLTSRDRLLQGKEEDLKEGLLQAAGVMFLYVVLMVETILLNPSLSHSDVLETLESLKHPPKSLFGIYEKYMSAQVQANSEKNNQIAVRVLQWILYCQSVSPNLLRVALAIDLDDGGLNPDKLCADIEAVTGLILGILVEWRKTERGLLHATLMHHSLQEYLIRSVDTSSMPPALKLIHDATQPIPAQTQILTTCCTVMGSLGVRMPLHTYYDSVDWRRQLRDARLGRLEDHMIQGERWEKWEKRQLNALEEDWQWRKGTETYLQDELQDFEDELGPVWASDRKHKLERLREAQAWEGQDIHDLRVVLNLRERDLLVYSFGHLSYHLIGAVEDSNRLNVTSFTALLDTFLQQIRSYAIQVSVQADTTQSFQSPRAAAAFVDLFLALQSLAKSVNDMDQLIHSDLSTLSHGWTRSYVTGSIFRHFLRSSFTDSPTQPDTIWNPAIVLSLETGQSTPGLRHLFTLVTVALGTLRNVEFALYNFDEQRPVILGTSILVHTLQRTAQGLAQWMVFHACRCPTENRERIDLLVNDNFLYPKLLVLLARPTIESHHRGVLLFDKDLWNSHPFFLSLALLFYFILGATTTLPLWISIIMVDLCSEEQFYGFQAHHPSVTRRILHSFPPSLVAGWLVSRCGGLEVPLLICGTAALGLLLHATRFVRFQYSNVHGALRFETEIVNARLMAMVAITNHMISHNTAWYGVAAAAIMGRPFNDVLNLVAVCFSVHRILSLAIDPMGTQHALTQLSAMPDLFGRSQQTHSDLVRSEPISKMHGRLRTVV